MGIVLFAVICGTGLGAIDGTVNETLQLRPADRVVEIDEQGVLRWQDDGTEVCLFGVNYYAPHTVDFTHLKAVGVSIEDTIDQDLAHFARMGLDLIRIHVFDREISDREGNLLENEHLALLDYLIARAKAHGIYTALTPIAWWGTDHSIGGFSAHYSMPEMISNLDARAAQRRYLAQFATHVNPHTGLAYKDDPAIPVFELINEPLYPPGFDNAQLVEYINALVEAIRDTGCSKPLFYNGWDNRHAAVRDANLDGCTFGWYPSGLASGRSLNGNFLPQVQDYPSMRSPELARKAKMVYEFDAADIPGSYLYAAMARSFRSGGAQLAAQFQYDPLPVAEYNAGWGTHYLNLVYTPQRAVGFLTASAAFHQIPRHADFGTYPESNQFGVFRVSFEEDLAEMVSDDAFFYSNNTRSAPPALDKLRRLAGCGSSPVVQYEGTGAYFLDRFEPGAWRLEVYPDAVWVNDPFSLPLGLDREMSRVVWRSRRFEVGLPDLGAAFFIKGLNNGNNYVGQAEGGSFAVSPGVYLLSRRDEGLDIAQYPGVGRVGTREFVAPPQTRSGIALRHEPLREIVEGMPVTVSATIVGDADPEEVTLHVQRDKPERTEALPMTFRSAFQYEAEIPGDWVKTGILHYAIGVRVQDASRTFPWNLPVSPEDFSNPSAATRVLMNGWEGEPPAINGGHAAVVPGSSEKTSAIQLTVPGFADGAATGVRFPVKEDWQRPSGRSLPSDEHWELVVRGRSLYPQTRAVEIGIIDMEGNAYGAEVPLNETWRDVHTEVKSLRKLWNTNGNGLTAASATRVSIVFGAWLYGAEHAMPHGIELEYIALTPASPFWQVPVLSRNAPVVLFDAARHPIRARGDVACRQDLVGGSEGGATAVRIAVESFGSPPSSVAARNDIREELVLRQDYLPECTALRLTARGRNEYTDSLELVLTEEDGSAWGTTVPLTTEWQAIEVPLPALRLFRHWGGVPKERGYEGDSLNPANVAQVNVCFGAWLYPEHFAKPHAIEIEQIVLIGK